MVNVSSCNLYATEGATTVVAPSVASSIDVQA